MRPIYFDECQTMIELQQKGPTDWYVMSVRTKKEYRGEGRASNLLRIVCRDADLEGVTLTLDVRPHGWPGDCLNEGQLKSWYERMGFVMIDPLCDLYERTPR